MFESPRERGLLAYGIMYVYRCPSSRMLYANPCSEHIQRCLQYVALNIRLFTTATDRTVICLPISQVVRIRMPFKQKLGVLSIFLLGFLVVISSSTFYTLVHTSIPILTKPVIRAIYSSKNQQLITCTVSMIETAIAVIAACLPVLRTLFFGSRSRSGTSNSRAYELSFGNDNKGVTNISAQRRSMPPSSRRGLQDESEDELVKDAAVPEREGIEVTTEYRVGL